MILHIDIESYSPTDLKDGVYKYSLEGEIQIIGWAVDNGPVQQWNCADFSVNQFYID